MIRVEYFIIIDKKEEYLKESKHFINILKIIEGLSINDTLIKYNGVDIDYKVKIINVEDRIINCQFSIEDTASIDEFEKFLRVFRTIFAKIAGIESIETLWDDTGFYYAKLAYPIIHKIENEMRSLITKFMYINVGRNWASKHVPEEVKNSIKNKKNNNSKEIANFLDKVDFIQLTNFLFEEYSSSDKNKIISFIKENKNNDFKYEQLEKYIPISNWDRFFKDKLNIESKELKNKWEELYQLRCKIAHNNKINKLNYEKIKELSDDIGEKIKYAMDSLDTIKIDEEDKANIFDKIYSITDELESMVRTTRNIKFSSSVSDALKSASNISLSSNVSDALKSASNISLSSNVSDALKDASSTSLSSSVLDVIKNTNSISRPDIDNRLSIEDNINKLEKK